MKENFSRFSLGLLILAIFCLSLASAIPGSTIYTDKKNSQFRIFYNDKQEILHTSDTTTLVSYNSNGSIQGKIRSIFSVVKGNLTITKVEVIAHKVGNINAMSRSNLKFNLAESVLSNNETQLIIDGTYGFNGTVRVIDQLVFNFKIYFKIIDNRAYDSFNEYTHILTVGKKDLLRNTSLIFFAIFVILFLANFFLFTIQPFSVSIEFILQMTYAITAISVINSGFFQINQLGEIWMMAIFTPISLVILPMIIDQKVMRSVVVAVSAVLSTENDKLQTKLKDPELTETKKKFLTKTHQVNIRSIKSKYLQRLITYISERMMILMTFLFVIWAIFEFGDFTLIIVGPASITMVLFFMVFPDPRPEKVMQISDEN